MILELIIAILIAFGYIPDAGDFDRAMLDDPEVQQIIITEINE